MMTNLMVIMVIKLNFFYIDNGIGNCKLECNGKHLGIGTYTTNKRIWYMVMIMKQSSNGS